MNGIINHYSINNYGNQKLRGLKRKYEYILRRGGKCEYCGYNKNLAALEFHHRNPEEKEFQVDARAFSNHSLEKLERELEKCSLLCANCHRERHNQDLIMENIPELIKEAVNKKSFSNQETYGQVCPVCGKRFRKTKGKIYCSEECRWKAKNGLQDLKKAQWYLSHLIEHVEKLKKENE